MSNPINPPPVTEEANGDLPAYLSNWLIGLRVVDIPLRTGMTVVSGLSGRHPVAQVEAAARAPYPADLDVAGQRTRRPR